MIRPDAIIYTDGSYASRSGRGAYCALIVRGDLTEEVTGVCDGDSDSCRMEMMAVIAGLQAVRTGSLVILRSDSQYVVQNYPKLGQWLADGTLDGDRARPNADLWLALIEASRPHLVIVEWIRGHADCVEQNHCHDRARALAIEDAAQAAA